MAPVFVLDPYKSFESNWKDTEKLFKLFQKENAGRKGRSGLGYLRKAMLVTMLSHWESYVEDEILRHYQFKYKNIRKVDSLPDGFRHALENHLKEEHGDKWGWELCGQNWKRIAEDYAKSKCDHLNTPSHKNIDRIMKTLFAVRGFSDGWKWQSMSAPNAIEKLTKIIKTRGAIAHGRKPEGKFDYNTISRYKTHIENLAWKTSELFDELREET